jgi:hypothetical protein
MIKRIFLAGLSLLFVFFFFSCPAQQGGTSYTITGTIHDAYNGALIPGATFRFADKSSTTGSDGAFSIDLGTTGGVFNGSVGVTANGYSFTYIDTIEVNTADNNQITIKLHPLSNVTYTPKVLHCKIYDTDGTTEITDASVTLATMSKNGSLIGAAGQGVTYDSGNGYYPFTTITYSADSMVFALATFTADHTKDFIVHKTGVDLSGPGPIDVSLTKPSTGFHDVSVTVDSVNCQAQGNYITPYGTIPIFARYTTLGNSVLSNSIVFLDGTTTETVTVYNPDSWQCFWAQMRHDTAYTGTGYKNLISSSAIMALPSAVTIPSIDAGIGPTADPNLSSWQYNYTTGALSIDAVAGALSYQYGVVDASSITWGSIVLLNNAATLPSWLTSILYGKSPLTFSLTLVGSDLTAYKLSFASLDTSPPSARLGLLQAGQNTPYTKTF